MNADLVPLLREFIRDNLLVHVRERGAPDFTNCRRVEVSLSLRGDDKPFDSDYFDLPESAP